MSNLNAKLWFVEIETCTVECVLKEYNAKTELITPTESTWLLLVIKIRHWNDFLKSFWMFCKICDWDFWYTDIFWYTEVHVKNLNLLAKNYVLCKILLNFVLKWNIHIC